MEVDVRSLHIKLYHVLKDTRRVGEVLIFVFGNSTVAVRPVSMFRD